MLLHGSIYVHVGHARIEFLIQELTHVRIATVEVEVRSSSVSVAYVVRLRIVFSKAALQKRGSMEPMEPPLDPPLANLFPHKMEPSKTNQIRWE